MYSTYNNKSADMRRWLLNQETELLRCRYRLAQKKDREEFFLYYKSDFNFEDIEIPHHEDPCWDKMENPDPVLMKVWVVSDTVVARAHKNYPPSCDSSYALLVVGMASSYTHICFVQ